MGEVWKYYLCFFQQKGIDDPLLSVNFKLAIDVSSFFLEIERLAGTFFCFRQKEEANMVGSGWVRVNRLDIHRLFAVFTCMFPVLSLSNMWRRNECPSLLFDLLIHKRVWFCFFFSFSSIFYVAEEVCAAFCVHIFLFSSFVTFTCRLEIVEKICFLRWKVAVV